MQRSGIQGNSLRVEGKHCSPSSCSFAVRLEERLRLYLSISWDLT
jgi:hypothetical protein